MKLTGAVAGRGDEAVADDRRRARDEPLLPAIAGPVGQFLEAVAGMGDRVEQSGVGQRRDGAANRRHRLAGGAHGP